MNAVTPKISPEAPDEAVAPFDNSLRASKTNLQPEGHSRNRYWHKAGPGVTQDHIRHQDYWANLAKRFTRHDIVTVMADDESWEAELCAEHVIHGAVQMSVRKVYKRVSTVHAGRVVDGLGNFFSQWRAGDGWCIVRRDDGHPVIRGHTLEATAIAQWHREQPKMVV